MAVSYTFIEMTLLLVSWYLMIALFAKNILFRWP
jgi:hypothetical protein